MVNDVWYTWHDVRFDCDKYLYHYTSIEKAIKILYNKSLRFSPIVNTNDTVEAKVKISFNRDEIKDFNKKRQKINQYMQKYNEYLQLLCFCKDTKKDKRKKTLYTMHDDMYYIDMMGRGFSLPRMWAQYADNNKGVCIIIDKQKFENECKRKIDIILSEKVNYETLFSAFKMDTDTIEALYESVCEDDDTTMTGYVFAKKHIDYVKYSFFTKFLDWENENEYRYLIGSDNTKPKEVKNLSNYIAGIVLGERIEEDHKWTIEQLAKRLAKTNPCIAVKKIYFDYNCCRLS